MSIRLHGFPLHQASPGAIIQMIRTVRRRLERAIRKIPEKDPARHALAVLHLWETPGSPAEVAHRVRAARSSVQRRHSSCVS